MRKKKTNDQFIKEVYNLVGDEYTFLENYSGSLNKIECKHNECGNVWSVMPNKFLIGTRCPKCSVKGVGKKTNQQFIREVYELVGYEYKFLEQYKDAKTKIKCRHNISECGFEWYVLPIKFLTETKCPKCFGNSRKTDDEFRVEVSNLVGYEYVFLEPYINAKTKIKCKHNIDECGFEWLITPKDFLNDRRCPKCASSKGEVRVASWLDTNNIKYMQEYKFEDCRYILQLPFDFYLPDYNLLIEYDGEQHYKPARFGGISEEQAKIKLKEIKIRDNIKTQYCKTNNISLLRIPYTKYNSVEKILLNNINTLNKPKNKTQLLLKRVV